MSVREIEAQMRALAAEAAQQGLPDATQKMFKKLALVAGLETGTRSPETHLITGATEEEGRQAVEVALSRHMVRDRAVFEAEPYIRKLFFEPHTGETVTTSYTDDSWSVSSGGYSLNATLDQKRAILELEAELTKPAKDGSTTRHPLLPRYSTLMKLSVDYFEGLGFNVQAILGAWAPDYGGQPNTNWVVYQEAIARGQTREAAALLTPTGKIASRLGFQYPYIIPDDPRVKHDEGVDLMFYKRPR